MPALKPTEYVATVRWVGCVPTDPVGIASEKSAVLDLDFAGAKGDVHAGRTRPSCVRVTSQHPKGTEIANVRQLSVVSVEELQAIAAEMGLDAIDPVWLGATLVIEGIPDFTHVPPSSRLQGPDGGTLIVDMENRPCQLPAREIAAVHPEQSKAFKAAAKHRRGVTAWVERPGRLTVGDTLRLHIPDQPVWAFLDQARA
ncbi:MOSC domain-containing protein [Marivita sp. S6314]|uniref:MOSC domain-containing protein n=1 Tax=Marivita sp. S6314 TaxID=2926406 RepID=UPI001FF32FFA|nr:MOSC domain-containing protein [Marivita sp. S6314]MCK0151919.1 MOSC domain-containing protein [Marivita sp. S6314]